MCLALLQPALADPVVVRHLQGSAHAFLSLQTLEGHPLAVGDLTQSVHGDRVTSRLTFRFQDGSLDDETTVFLQRHTFRLLTDHHIQRGPSFPNPLDMFIHAMTGLIISKGVDGKIAEDHLDLPPDVANGLPPNLLMNLSPLVPETKLSYVAPQSKPRLVHLSIKPAEELSFKVGGTPRKALHYVIHIEPGGIAGVVAPLIGKQPADVNLWLLGGEFPAFIRMEGQLYEGGPIWRVEQISPTFGTSVPSHTSPR